MKTTQANGRQIFIILSTLVVLLCATNVQATAFTASVTGDWSSTATWGGSGPPGAADTVTINPNITVTVSDTRSVTSVAFSKATGNTANKLAISGTGSLTASGAFSISTGSAGTSTIDLSGGAGSLIMSFTGTPIPAGIVLTTGSSGSTVNYSGGNQTVNPVAYQKLILSGSGAKTVSSVTLISSDFTINGTATASFGAAFTVGGNLTVNQSSATGTALQLFNAASAVSVIGTTTVTLGTLRLGGQSDTSTFAGNFTVNGGTFDSNGGKPNFGGNFTLSSGSLIDASNASGRGWTFNGGNSINGGTFTMPSSVWIGTGKIMTNNATGLTISGGGSNPWLTGNSANATGGTLVQGASASVSVNNANLGSINCTAFTPNTVIYTGNSVAIPVFAYNHLTIGGSGNANLGSITTVNGNLTCNAGVAFNPWPSACTVGGTIFYNGNASTVAGNISCGAWNETTAVNGGTFTITVTGSGWTSANFTPQTGTVKFTGASPTINSAAAFNNLTIGNGTATCVTTLGANPTVSSTCTVANNATLDCSTFNVAGTGAFTVSAGGGIRTANASGITATGDGTVGSVQVSGTRTYNATASYQYKGTMAQVTGSGLPITVSNLIVNTTGGGLTLTSSETVTRLSGAGTVGNTITVAGFGTISPGNSPGTLTVTNLTLGSTSTNFFELTNSTAIGGGTNDFVVVDGTLTAGNSIVVISNYCTTPLAVGDYILYDYSVTGASLSGSFNATPVWASAITNDPLNTASIVNDSGNKRIVLRIVVFCTSPTAYQVTGGTNCSSSGVTVGLAGSDVGINYQLFTNGVAYDVFVAGTGSALAPGAWAGLFTAGTYTIVGTNTSGGCTTTMAGNAVVSQAPTATYNVTGGDGCSSPGVTVGLSGSDVGVTYLLLLNGSQVGSTVAGTGSAISFAGTQTAAGTYTVQGTNIGCGIVAINGGSPSSVVITATPGAPTSASATPGDNQASIGWTAPGGSVTGYNVYRSTASGAETFLASAASSPYIDSTAADGTQYFYKVTAVNGSCESVVSTEVAATPNPAYTAYVITDSASGNPTAGVSDTLTITAVNGGSGVSIGGPVALVFSGLGNSPGGTAPTVGGTAFSGGSVTNTVTFTSGVANVALVAYNAGVGQTLAATDGTHGTAGSGGSPLSMTVSQAANSAYRLTGTGSPKVGVNYTVNVALVDQYQNVSAFTGNTNLTFNTTSNLSAGADGSVATINGVAQNTAAAVSLASGTGSVILVAHKVESGKSVTVTDGSLTSSTTGGTNLSLGTITEGVSTQLGISTQPSSTATAGAAFAQQPVIKTLDMYSNPTTSNALVTATASAGNLRGPASTNAVSGTATFTGLSLTNSSVVTLTFATPGMASTNSTAITVSPSALVGVAWITQPGGAVYGAAFGTQPVLMTVDLYGNPTTNGLTAVKTVTVSHTSGGGALVGTTSYNIGTSGSNGVITFTDLQINAAGTNNQLTAFTSSGQAPTNYAGLNLWLDASDISSTALNGTSVTNWTDKSGAGHSATNSAGTAPTIATNATLAAAGVSAGRVVRFNGSTTILGVTGNLTFMAGVPYTIIAMEVANNNAGTASYFIGTDPTGTDRALQIGYRNSGDFTLAQYGDDFDYTTTFTYPQARLWTCKANNGGAGGRVIYLNGTSVATSGNTAVLGAPTGGYIGASFGRGEHYNGDLAEIIVFNNALTDAQRTNVETYLLNKWTTGLPGVATASFTVSPATVTIASGVAATDKVYDGNTNATLTIGTVVFSGVLPADTNNVSLNSSNYTAYFANAGPANNIPVTVSGLTLSGSAATNYSLTQPASLTANITVPITYSGYAITDGGNGNAQAGVADQLMITAVNSDGSTQSGVNGNILLSFSGLSSGSDSSTPTITDEFGSAQILGATNTLINFTNGISVLGGSLVPHKNEMATLQVADAAGHGSASPGGTNLSLTVSVGTNSAYQITTTNSAPVVGAGDTLAFTVVDMYQNVNNGFAGTPSIIFGGLANGPDGSQPTINGTAFGTGTPIAFSGGSASATLVAHKAENNKLLTATGGTLTAGTTAGAAPTLSPTAGTAMQLGISTQPSSNAVAGVAFVQQPVLVLLDQYGNLTTSNAQVTATASVGNLQGPAVTNAVSGIATYGGLSITNLGTNILTFSSPGLASTNSTLITVGAGAVTALVWTTQPGTAVHGTPFGTPPALQTVDQFGNFSTNGLPATASVTLSLSGGGTLSGTTNGNIGTLGGAGQVMFTNLSINGAGSGKQLIATAAGYGTPVSGMAVWLDANNSSSVTMSGGQVTAWNDLSGNGNQFATTLANGGHIYYTNSNPSFSGRKTVTFAGNYLKNTSYTNVGPDISVFVVFRTTVNSTANGSYNRPFGLWAGTAGRADYQSTGSFNYDIGPNANAIRIARNEQDCGGGADLTALNGVNLTSSYYDAEFIATNSANTLYANGGNVQTDGNCVGNFSVAAAAVGGGLSGTGGYNGGLFGDVAELLVYNTSLNTTDRQAVESYLNKKWQSGSAYIASADLSTTSSPFTVNPALLSITATNQGKTYGQTVAFGSGSTAFTSSGLVGGDTIDSVTLTCSGGAGTAPVSGSPYTIMPSAPIGGGFSAANYSIVYTNGTLTVNPAALSITASNQSKSYGQTVAFGSGSTAFTSSGLQNGETIGSVTLTCSGGVATAPVSGSPYTITPSYAVDGTFATNNYIVTYNSGTLTITAASSGLAVSSSVNPSGFGGSVTFTATVPSDASGNVIFKANGTPLGTNIVSAGTATNLTATLLRGTNTITAEYSGDANYLGGTNALSGGQVVTNHPPVAGLMTVTRLTGMTVKIALSDIATNWSDQDGDSLSLTNINLTTTNGITLVLLNVTTNSDGSYVITNTAYLGYSNSLDVADQLNYTITDGFGGSTVGYINITVSTGSVFGQGNPQIISTNGGVQVTFYGIPNYTYIVQRNLVGLDSPLDWLDFSTNTAPTNNPAIIITDTNNPAAFYRLMWQP